MPKTAEALPTCGPPNLQRRNELDPEAKPGMLVQGKGLVNA